MSKIIEVAKKYIGVTENPENSNKTIFGKWAKFDGVAWCGLFVSKCYEEAGYPLPKIGFRFNGFAGCQTAAAYFVKNGWVIDAPEEGDIVLYDWNGDGRYDHTGIFVGWVDDTTFEAIEGNTSLTNQSNGGSVMLRRRKNKGVIFARPQ